MEIEFEKKGPWTMASMSGDLTAEAGPNLYLRFHRELLSGATNFLFDLSRVEFMDSKGLAVVVRCYKDAKARGGEVSLCSVPASIQKVLEFTTLDNIFRVGDADMLPAVPPDLQAA